MSGVVLFLIVCLMGSAGRIESKHESCDTLKYDLDHGVLLTTKQLKTYKDFCDAETN
jgi:hypothetical protein